MIDPNHKCLLRNFGGKDFYEYCWAFDCARKVKTALFAFRKLKKARSLLSILLKMNSDSGRR